MGHSSKKILLVDDSRVVHSEIKLIIKNSGENYQLSSAYNALEAHQVLKKHQFDIILLDINMPGTDGLEFCRQLRKEPAFQNIPIIFLTVEKKYLVKALEAGGNDFLGKPFSPEEFNARISNLIKLHELQEVRVETEKLAALTTMVTTFNHEINNPLTISLLNLSLIKNEIEENKFTKYLETSLVALKRIQKFLSDVRSIDQLDLKDYSVNAQVYKKQA